jgi:rubrerythrin
MADTEKQFNPVDVLHLAIQREKEAQAFYTEMAERFSDPAAREMLISMAKEEKKHQQQLEAWLEEHFQRDM